MSVTAAKLDVWNRALFRVGSTELLESETDDCVEAETCGLVYDDVLRRLLEAQVWPWALREAPLSTIDEQTTTTAGDAATVNFTIPADYVDTQQVVVVLIDNTGAETTLEAGDDYTFSDDGTYVTLVSIPAADEFVQITVTCERVGWEHVYALPADCVTPVIIMLEDVRRSQVPTDYRVPFEIMVNDGGDGRILCCDLDEDEIAALQYVADIDSVTLMPRAFVDALVAALAMELATALKKDAVLRREIKQEDFEPALDRASVQAMNIGADFQTMTPALVERG